MKNQSDIVINISDLHKSYGNLEVLKGIDLSIRRGEVVVVLGGSGSGKSTMLRCINFLEPFHIGSITVDGMSVGYNLGSDGRRIRNSESENAELRKRVGMVFQGYNLFPHRTVLQNLMVGPVKVRKIPEGKARANSMRLLEKVGMVDKADVYPAQLSGGQQQRVAIARALAMEPTAMLFDEVTSALDPELVQEVLLVMRDLAAEGMTMVVVTHEMDFARDVADHVVFMEGGTIVEAGSPSEVMTNPQTPRFRNFLGRHLSR